MNNNFVVLDDIPIRIGLEEVFRQLGYPQGGNSSSRMEGKIQADLDEVLPLLEPKGAYLWLPEGETKGFELFSGAGGMVLALTTIDSTLETYSAKLIKSGRSATGLVVDAVGTIAVEQTADFVEDKIRQDATRYGWKVSRRYAPGYCGWPLEAQRDIFSYFPNTLGIRLTDGCLMKPEKSLSFMCLLSSNGNFQTTEIGDCLNCSQKECPYRKNNR